MSALPSVGRSVIRSERAGEAGFVVLRKLHLLGVRRRSLVGDVEEGRKAWTERDMGPRGRGEGCSHADMNAVS